jgi:hypothetical protein
VHEIGRIAGEDERMTPRPEVGLEVGHGGARGGVLEPVVQCSAMGSPAAGTGGWKGEPEADAVHDLLERRVRDQRGRAPPRPCRGVPAARWLRR